ncbi:MAG: IclR family transcriptional regulator [Halomonas sp.]|nr:IclR family transcriptional regulator [Halomonas sp.]MBP5980785.1 IclR family transcriptional regulator [Halomonas sp.]
MKQASSGGSQTVDRALTVLNVIVDAEESVSLERVSAVAELHRSIVYRLLRSLESAGYVARQEEGGGYRVGPRLVAMSVSVARRFDLGSILRPVMQELVERFGETVSLHMLSGHRRVCVDVAEGTHPVRRVIPIGENHPAFAGETGRALLACLSPKELAPQLEYALEQGVDVNALQRDIERTRQDGFFIGVGTRTPGVGSVSIPLAGFDGTFNALTISGPADRWSRESMQSAIPVIMERFTPIHQYLLSAEMAGNG